MSALRLLLAAVWICWLSTGCSKQTARGDLTQAERQEDLAVLAAEFGQREQSFTAKTRKTFEMRLAVVESGIGTMSHDAFIAGIQWAVAAADNGHSEALAHEHHRRRLPVTLEWFADGLYVVAARPGYEELLGARVESIEGYSADELLVVLDAYAPGTAEHARVVSAYFLQRPELLAAAGVAASAEHLSIDFVTANGAKLTRSLPGQPGPGTARADDTRRVVDDIEPLPLYLRDPAEPAFSAWLPELDAIYVRINQNYDKSLPAKLDGILAAIAERTPRNAIVDLRLNGGGNYELTAPFAESLPALLPGDGKLVLIIGNRTFSAAIVTAAILKARADGHAIIVGEPAGDELQFWSEGGFLVLPNSGLRIHYSDGYHDWMNGFDPTDSRHRANPRIAAVNARYSAAAGSLEPQIQVPLRFADYAAGRDPVMAKAAAVLGAAAP